MEDGDQRFYRAHGTLNGSALMVMLGLVKERDFGGCGGSIRSRFNPSVTIALTA